MLPPTTLRIHRNNTMVISNNKMYYNFLNRQSIFLSYLYEKQQYTKDEVRNGFFEIILRSREITVYLPHQYNLNNIIKYSETI